MSQHFEPEFKKKIVSLSSEKSLIIIDEIEAGLDIDTKTLLLDLEKDIFKNNKNSIIFKISHENVNNNIYTKVINF